MEVRRRTLLVAMVAAGLVAPARGFGQQPVEQASKFELIVNLATARLFAISFPKSFLARADRVIE